MMTAYAPETLVAGPELCLAARTEPRVLIIEDDADCHEGWALWLRHHGYDVSSARDGRTGLELLEFEAPDLVVLDLGLPGVDGFGVLAEMRTRAWRVPVIVVSATSSVETDMRAYSLGALCVLPKPASVRQLGALVTRVLEGR